MVSKESVDSWQVSGTTGGHTNSGIFLLALHQTDKKSQRQSGQRLVLPIW